MQTSDIMIINRLDTGTAFATTIVGNENVFIPGKITALLNVQIGERYEAVLIKNTILPHKTPWMAIRLNRISKPAEPNAQDELAIKILNDLRENGTATVNEMASAIDHPMFSVLAKMQEMARGGMLVRRTMYAINEADFERVDE